MKKDGIQTRNRKISTKNKNKKRGPSEGPFYDMLKPQANPYGDMKFHLPSAHAYIPAATQTPYPAQFIFHASWPFPRNFLEHYFRIFKSVLHACKP